MIAAEDGMTSIERIRPFDRALLGLEPHPDDPNALSVVIAPRLCRVERRSRPIGEDLRHYTPIDRGRTVGWGAGGEL